MSPSRSVPTLLVDLGGTNVRFGVADTSRPRPLLADSIRRYRVAEHDSLVSTAKHYLADTGLEVKRAIIAAAGRIVDGETVKVTNNPWAISARQTASALNLTQVHLVNDFAAQSMAVTLLQGDDLVDVGTVARPVIGSEDKQTFAIVGPGTGLGVGGLLVRQRHCSVLQTEGGHAGFAAHTPEDIAILDYLNHKYGRVSNERLICGQGLVNLYDAICHIVGAKAADLRPEDITKRAKDGSCPLCTRTVETFAGIFGSVTGDLVLTLGAWDGVYLTGGLIPVLLPWLERGRFRERFEAKGRFRDIMEKVPTQAIMNPEPGLLGAAALAVMESGQPLLPSR
ncbi:MAG: glucokinase [Rhodanobacter sp.]|nr:MAG: glucokinase [Rhodanobacter sp.]TAL90208.1 MAG: glucokinase [Rhodanobacter sp.]TAM39702.1 MAG: glucokinase [Rhodanobacter sp.]TAN25234.1 MAG: glucokinase [Rhodanobacter sp.]